MKDCAEYSFLSDNWSEPPRPPPPLFRQCLNFSISFVWRPLLFQQYLINTLLDSQFSEALYVGQSLFRFENLRFISFSPSQPSHPNPRNKKLWENSIQMAKALCLSYISVILNCVRYIKLYVKQKLVIKSEHLEKANCD